jgi:hypothetical protein
MTHNSYQPAFSSPLNISSAKETSLLHPIPAMQQSYDAWDKVNGQIGLSPELQNEMTLRVSGHDGA